MSTIRTHTAKRGEAVSRQEARQGVVFAQAEVLRAEKRCDMVEKTYRDLLAASHSWLAECQRRLRVATLQLRRIEPVEHAEPVDPAPWLPPTAPTLLNWRDKITIDAGRVSDD